MTPPPGRHPMQDPDFDAGALAADEQLDDILSIVEDLRRQLKNAKEMNARLAEELRGVQDRALASEAQAGKLGQELERVTRQLSDAKAENETLVSEAVAVQEDQHESAREIVRLRQDVHLLEEKTQALELEREKLRQMGVDVAGVASAKEEPLRKRVQELEEEIEEMATRLEAQGREIRRAGVTIADLTKEKEALQAEVDELERYRKAIGRIHGALRGPEST